MNSFILDTNKYNLSEDEITSLYEANKFLELNHNLYAIHELYNSCYINILRRIEFFGREEVLTILNKNSHIYYEDNEDINKRWIEFTYKEIIKIVKFFNILNKTTLYLFISFYNSKKSFLLSDTITKDYILSFFDLLKNELFTHKYVKYNKDLIVIKSRSSDILSHKRRINDEYNIEDDKKQKKQEPLPYKNNHFQNKDFFNPYLVKDSKQDQNTSIYI